MMLRRFLSKVWILMIIRTVSSKPVNHKARVVASSSFLRIWSLLSSQWLTVISMLSCVSSVFISERLTEERTVFLLAFMESILFRLASKTLYRLLSWVTANLLITSSLTVSLTSKVPSSTDTFLAHKTWSLQPLSRTLIFFKSLSTITGWSLEKKIRLRLVELWKMMLRSLSNWTWWITHCFSALRTTQTMYRVCRMEPLVYATVTLLSSTITEALLLLTMAQSIAQLALILWSKMRESYLRSSLKPGNTEPDSSARTASTSTIWVLLITYKISILKRNLSIMPRPLLTRSMLKSQLCLLSATPNASSISWRIKLLLTKEQTSIKTELATWLFDKLHNLLFRTLSFTNND